MPENIDTAATFYETFLQHNFEIPFDEGPKNRKGLFLASAFYTNFSKSKIPENVLGCNFRVRRTKL